MSHAVSRRYYFFLIVFSLLIVSSSAWLLIRANGYRILTHPFRIVKTGVISLTIHPDDSQLRIRLNGQLDAPSQRDLIDLAPGRYTVLVEHDGFSSWETTIDLAAGQAIRFPSIILFYDHPIIQTVTDPAIVQADLQLLNNSQTSTDKPQVTDGEIWSGDELITRFTNQVEDVVWLPDRHHLAAIVDQTVHIFDDNGAHDVGIATIPPGTKIARLAVVGRGEKLIVETDDQLREITITPPFAFANLPRF